MAKKTPKLPKQIPVKASTTKVETTKKPLGKPSTSIGKTAYLDYRLKRHTDNSLLKKKI